MRSEPLFAVWSRITGDARCRDSCWVKLADGMQDTEASERVAKSSVIAERYSTHVEYVALPIGLDPNSKHPEGVKP